MSVDTNLTEPAKKLLNSPAESAGRIATTLLDALHNTILLPVQKYNIKAEATLKQYREKINNEINKIPENEKTEPSVSIWGQTFERLKWNLDDQQEYIRNMYTNLLMSDIQKNTKSKILPSFITIVEQLSLEDAEFLETLYKTGYTEFSTIEFRWTTEEGYYKKVPNSSFVIVLKKGNLITPKMQVIENLERLGIVKWEHGIFLTAEKDLCREIFKKARPQYEIPDSLKEHYAKTDFKQEKLIITEYGQNFLDICLRKQ